MSHPGSLIRSAVSIPRHVLIAIAVLIGSVMNPSGACADIIVVTNTNDTGAGSLRQAIEDANNNVGVPDQIEFNIPGPAPHTIAPKSALPMITDPVIIDGGLQIELSGSSAAGDGLVLQTTDSTLMNLMIDGFTGGSAIVVGGPFGEPARHMIMLNFIGSNAAPDLIGIDSGVMETSSQTTSLAPVKCSVWRSEARAMWFRATA